METETKINFVWIVLAVILAGVSIPIWAIALTPPGLIVMGLFICVMVAVIGRGKQEAPPSPADQDISDNGL